MNPTLRMRLLTLHRWTGLTVGLLLLFLAITGLGLEFRDQLAPVIEPSHLRPASCAQPVPLDAQLAAARAAHATGKLENVILNEAPGAPTLVRYTDNAHVYVDACSGRVVEQRARWGGVFGRLEQLHRFRFLEDKDVANAVTGAASIVMALVMVGGGLLLWWPLRRHGWRTAAALRPHLKGRAFDLNLHRTAGLYAGVVLFVMALASLPLAFEWPRDALNAITGSPRPAPKPASMVPADAKPMKAGALWQRAQVVLDEPGKVVLAFPKKKTDALEIYALERGAPHGEARSYLWLDAYSGDLLRFEPYVESSAGNKAFRTLAAMHKGELGLTVQLAQFIATLAIPVLAFTGLRSFVRGRRKPRADGRLAVRVLAVRDEAVGIKSFELVSADRKPLPPFSAGAHINVHVDAHTVRPYSLCNDPDERDRYLIAVRRADASRGGSRAMHRCVKPGDLLSIDPPRNHFPLDGAATHHVLLAGGIGITPLLAMAQALQRQRQSFGCTASRARSSTRRFTICCRSRASRAGSTSTTRPSPSGCAS